MLSLTAAVATALLLGLIARDDIGIPADTIRTDALSVAGLIFAAVSFGTLLGRRKN
jgi:H+/gluconate symporter-like permease